MTYQPELSREIEAARALLYAMRDDLDGDDQTTLDMVEGQTNLQEAMQAAVLRVRELEAHMEALSEVVDQLRARKARMETGKERIRTTLLSAMNVMGVRKIALAVATIGVRNTPEYVDLADESRLPQKFLIPQPPKPDKRLILAALKTGEHIDGARLLPGRQTIAIT